MKRCCIKINYNLHFNINKAFDEIISQLVFILKMTLISHWSMSIYGTVLKYFSKIFTY